MNYWKKVAFGLALIAGLCGAAWAQDFYQLGYAEGMRIGRADRLSNRVYQPRNYQAFKNGGSVSGDNAKQLYRNGFLEGYDRGFGRGDAYRRGPDRDDDRWERREGYEYRTYGEREGLPPGWNRGKKTGWDNCGLPPGQAKKYGCRTYDYEGHPHYYYKDEQGRIVVRRPATHPEGEAEKHRHDEKH